MTLKLAKVIAASYIGNLLKQKRGKTSSTMESAFANYEGLVDALSEDYEIMSDVIETLVNMGELTYRDGSFYYRDTTRLASQKVRVADANHQKSIALMQFLSKVAKTLGVGDHVYVVGGAVRNFVIDQPIKDIDVVIDALAIDPSGRKDSEWFAKRLADAIPVHTSLQTNQYGVAILTINESWMVEGSELQGEVIEIANSRAESYGGEGGKGYKPHMVELAPIEKDIERREFSFNTLMWQLSQLANGPDKAEIIDLTGCGLDDLQEGVMRCPSDPDKTFSDDPTRMLRSVKFLVKYGFRIDPIVAKAIQRNAQKLKQAPQNAISSILVDDILNMSQSKATLKVLKKLGLLDVVASMLEEDKAFRQTMANWAARDSRILFLFDMMDYGLPLNRRIRFLDDAQMARLRTVAIELGDKESESFVDLLKQPGRRMDTKALISEFKLQGPEIRKIMELARTVLLEKPSLRLNARSLTDAVRARLRNVVVSSSYYRASPDLTIEEVVGKWALEGSKIRGEGIHVWLDPKEVWPLREYTWTRENSRAGVTYVDGKLVDLPGPQKWDALKEDMKKNGWRKDQQPVILLVGKDGNAKVTEGNHRLAIARDLRMRKVPVQFMFRDSVSGGHEVVRPQKDKSRIDEVMDILNKSRR